ncbi:tripartite tricarboxylate transporter TctB family protein [Butyricicoccus sp. Marseille-Q5471]|uniref:tripartite tricarboxylate transporter TctB family protein n=1 Tax=Butyricicoccus sp. Marseille-Q5471 TaxID=3039493 RepID=UPI0024BCAF34|nr:tripartite tricarboxylate transporter TctB family protein [Butyricicoccus sp. Marseille-Q5471]
MKIKYNSEIISGIVFLVAAAILWVLVPSQIDTLETSAVNAQTIPRIAIGGMFLFSLGLLLQGVFANEKKVVILNRSTFASESFRKEMRSVLYALILLAYIVLLTFVGFLISTALLVVAILLFYGVRKWYYYAIPLAMVGVVYFVFKTLLHVSLP